MNLGDLLKQLGIYDYLQTDNELPALDKEIHVHFQPNYPLLGKISRVVDGEEGIHLAIDDDRERVYGSKGVWRGTAPDWDDGSTSDEEE